jgi:hypothetical protein
MPAIDDIGPGLTFALRRPSRYLRYVAKTATPEVYVFSIGPQKKSVVLPRLPCSRRPATRADGSVTPGAQWIWRESNPCDEGGIASG